MAPYKVALDDGRNIFAPQDIPEVIRARDGKRGRIADFGKDNAELKRQLQDQKEDQSAAPQSAVADPSNPANKKHIKPVS
ncbi:hypothetical protein TL16_g06316 [Triparma laevis f. inornata]|uniref:Uncharacterized protein n=1 Tax=Triparma laevis f. inornata TaxID=1714386 RepID=A0A9W7ALI7_9STRA|nr:hypothetical protein TL16_g06316 [Triparma laevis f. inornata]